jgi:GNAT superfamily N-acetyltransferase
LNGTVASSDPLRIRSLRPGDAGFVAYRHGVLYAREDGFDIAFDGYVIEGLNRFLQQYEPHKDHLWVAEWQGQPVGSIAIVRAAAGSAQLRWFLVEPELRGLGIGAALLETALLFCRDSGYSHVFLWTISHLHAARSLYERYGFAPTEQKTHFIWGRELTEERWDLRIKGCETRTRLDKSVDPIGESS